MFRPNPEHKEEETVEEWIKEELRAALDFECMLEFHLAWYGTYMGPALCMIDPTKIGYISHST